MKFPEFAWVDFAKGDVAARNNVVLIQDALATRDNGGAVNSYITVYRFPKAYLEHRQRNNSVAGYVGPAFADYLPIDIDRENDLPVAHRAALKVAVTVQEGFDVQVDQLRYFFSGCKGYHILIPTVLMGAVEPSQYLPRAFRTMAMGIADLAGETIDAKIYDVNRLFRLPDTQHLSGLWKVELTWAEFSTLGPDDHRRLAAQPRRLRWEPHDKEPIEALEEYFAKHILDAESGAERRVRKSGDGHAVALILQVAYVFPNRHKLALAFAGYAAKRSMPRETALGIIEDLAAGDDELDDRLRAVEDTYDKVRRGEVVLGIQDLIELLSDADLQDLKKAMGDVRQEPKEGRVTLEYVFDADKAGTAYLQYARELFRRRVTIGIPTLDRRMRGLMPGTVTTLIAKARVGKSAFAQNVRRNIARTIQEGATLFFSLEMPIELVWERDAQFALDMAGIDVERNMREAGDHDAETMIARVSRTIPRSYTVTASGLTLEDMAQYCELVTKTFSHRVVVILIDYLSLVRAPGRDLYQSTSHVARGLKTLAKDMSAPVIMLSQVRRRSADGDKVDGRTPPTLEDARDSGAVEEGSDTVIGAWRPKLDAEMGDDEIGFRLLKNRLGRGGGQDVFCRVNWKTLQLTELMDERIA